jgi:hypothetical protein
VLGQVFFLLLFRAEINNRQRADAGVRAVGDRKAAVNRNLFGEHRGGNLVETCAAVFFRRAAAHQAKLRGLAHKFRHQPRLLVLQVLRQRQHFLDHKLFRGLPDQLLIVRKVCRSKNVRGSGRFQQKAAALGCGFDQNGGGHW